MPDPEAQISILRVLCAHCVCAGATRRLCLQWPGLAVQRAPVAGAGAGREQKVLRAGEAVRTPVTHSKDTTSPEESEGNAMLWDKLICDR